MRGPRGLSGAAALVLGALLAGPVQAQDRVGVRVGDHPAFGRVVSGLDVVGKLKKGSDAEDGKVTDPDTMTRVRMASALPEAERPTVRVLNAGSAAFSVCDVQPVAEVTGG